MAKFFQPSWDKHGVIAVIYSNQLCQYWIRTMNSACICIVIPVWPLHKSTLLWNWKMLLEECSKMLTSTFHYTSEVFILYIMIYLFLLSMTFDSYTKKVHDGSVSEYELYDYVNSHGCTQWLITSSTHDRKEEVMRFGYIKIVSRVVVLLTGNQSTNQISHQLAVGLGRCITVFYVPLFWPRSYPPHACWNPYSLGLLRRCPEILRRKKTIRDPAAGFQGRMQRKLSTILWKLSIMLNRAENWCIHKNQTATVVVSTSGSEDTNAVATCSHFSG